MAKGRSARLILPLTIAIVAGCREDPSTGPAKDGDVAAISQSPIETARRLQDCHRRGAYTELAALVTPEAAASTIEFLEAVDRVIRAGRTLREAAGRAYGVPASETWGLGDLENNLGLFSAKTTFISQGFKGDRAIVTLQEADHVPLVRAEFEFRAGRWLHVPERYPPHVVPELLSLARLLGELAVAVDEGRPFDDFLDDFLARVPGQIRRVVRASEPPAGLAHVSTSSE